MTAEHWDTAYGHGDTTRSWYQPSADVSLDLLEGVPPTGAVIDVGGGASTLVDGLLERGFTDVTVLDVSDAGLRIARDRLGPRQEDVLWVTHDLLTWEPTRTYAAWHDRAVLHFLTRPDDMDRYRDRLLSATSQGSVAVLGTFGPDGPAQCSGLATHRYDAQGLMALLGPAFELETSFTADHPAPGGAQQQFQWVRAVRR